MGHRRRLQHGANTPRVLRRRCLTITVDGQKTIYGNATKLPAYKPGKPKVFVGAEPTLGRLSDKHTVNLWTPPSGVPKSRCPQGCDKQDVRNSKPCDFCNDPNVTGTSNKATGCIDMTFCRTCNTNKLLSNQWPTYPNALKRKKEGKKGYCNDCSGVRWLACMGDNYVGR